MRRALGCGYCDGRRFLPRHIKRTVSRLGLNSPAQRSRGNTVPPIQMKSLEHGRPAERCNVRRQRLTSMVPALNRPVAAN